MRPDSREQGIGEFAIVPHDAIAVTHAASQDHMAGSVDERCIPPSLRDVFGGSTNLVAFLRCQQVVNNDCKGIFVLDEAQCLEVDLLRPAC